MGVAIMCWKFKVGSWFGLGEYWVSEATSAPGIQYCRVGQKISSGSYGKKNWTLFVPWPFILICRYVSCLGGPLFQSYRPHRDKPLTLEPELVYQHWNPRKNGLFFPAEQSRAKKSMGAFRETDTLAGGSHILKTVTRITDDLINTVVLLTLTCLYTNAYTTSYLLLRGWINFCWVTSTSSLVSFRSLQLLRVFSYGNWKCFHIKCSKKWKRKIIWHLILKV